MFCWGYFSAELIAPPPTPLLLDRAGQYLAQVAAPGDLGYGYWPVDDLPPRVVAATLSLEDRRFWSHPGVDPLAILRAFKQNFDNGRRISGASTLAMQVARMQDPGPRDFQHKLSEAATAFFLTLRYGRAGKRVEITLAPDSRAGRPMVRLSVRDHGPGISREHLPRLTERFYRVDAAASRAKAGTGLGLAIVKHIVNRHQGTLTIDSELGQGATFSVLIPVAEEPRISAAGS